MVHRFETQVSGVKISYLKSGKAPDTILFLHGSGMSASNWLPQLTDKALSEHYTLIALDLPGHGKSDRIRVNLSHYRPAGMAELLSSFLIENKIESFLLAGLSFGTNVIGEMPAPLPGCHGLVLGSPCIVNNERPPSEVITAGPNGHVIVAFNPFDEELRAYVCEHMKNEVLAERYIKDYRATDPAFREQLADLTMKAGWTDELANVKRWGMPVCIIFGKEDSLLKTGYLDDFEPLWNNTVFKVKDAGHLVNEEQPEVFNKLLLDYARERFK